MLIVDFSNSLEPWHWLILGFLFLGLEALGAGGFLLGSALVALLLSFILWLVPETSWATQLMLFGVFRLVCALAYWKFFRKINNQNDHPQLNQRAAQLIGRVVTLEEPLVNGQGRIQIGDTLWKVRTSQPLEKGSQIVVTGTDGMTLIIELLS